ncbi:MAG: Rne/Rng family ribonuclease [Nitrospirae bacterium]|nr:Rne/Rng family ribonuclease [Nitrospirota bacterium]
MSKNMLINAAHPEECRVAIVKEGVLEELAIETSIKGKAKGNIYKGVVVRVEPSLQAAFVEYGGSRHGFIPFGEIRPDCYLITGEKKARYRIQDVICKGVELLVQVEKEERDTKGAFLTTHLSLPGRYMVLMPGAERGGVSRKIEDEAQRKRLKEILDELKPPEGFGVIVRTAGMGRTKQELSRDFQALMRLWEGIRKRSEEVSAPALVYEEQDVVIRTIRDYFTPDIDEILVDNKEVFKSVLEFFKATMPRYQHRVRLYQEKRPIFSKFNLEEQIETVYERKVHLPSGGSLVIDTTEALVAIDVNSGKATGERGMEETAFKTNLEAADMVALQIRLRDLGGLLIIDFIDMASRKHNQEVEKRLKNALKGDKAKIDLSRISKFGLLELSRERLRPPIKEGAYVTCFHCGGSGLVRSTESLALIILRKIQAGLAKGNAARVEGALSTEVASYLLNQKRGDLARLEQEHGVIIHLVGESELLSGQFRLEFIKQAPARPLLAVPEKEPPARGPVLEEEIEQAPSEAVAGAAPSEPPAEGARKRRRRRRRRKKKEHPAEAQTEAAPAQPEAALEILSPSERAPLE